MERLNLWRVIPCMKIDVYNNVKLAFGERVGQALSYTRILKLRKSVHFYINSGAACKGLCLLYGEKIFELIRRNLVMRTRFTSTIVTRLSVTAQSESVTLDWFVVGKASHAGRLDAVRTYRQRLMGKNYGNLAFGAVSWNSFNIA